MGLVTANVSTVPNEYVLLVVSIVIYEKFSFICDVFCNMARDLCFVSCLVYVLGVIIICILTRIDYLL